MSPRGPVPEYSLLLDAIQRLAQELGRSEVEAGELRRRLALVEARVAELNLAASLIAQPVEAAPAPTVVDVADTDLVVGEPAEAPPSHEAEVHQPDQDELLPPTTEFTPSPAASPTFTRIVPASAYPQATISESSPLPAVLPVVSAPGPAAGSIVSAPRASEPIWSRVPDRYRRAAWIAAPIVAVMVASTWITSADSPDTEPTASSQSGGIVSTSTVETRTTPFDVTILSSTPTAISTATSAPSDTASQTPSPARTATRGSISSTPPTGTVQATSTATSADEPTATRAQGATVTATTGTALSTTTPLPTPTSEPTQIGVPGEIVPGGVGSTETQVVETFGESDGEQDGRSSYSEGGVLVTYGAESRAVRVTFILNLDDLSISLDEAETLAEYYRPSGAQLLSTTTVEPGFVRRVYASTTLAALFAGSDTGGRAADRYVEEVRFDPSTQRARTIEMALGELP